MTVVFDFSATIKFCQMMLFVQNAEPGASTKKTKIFGVAPSTCVIRNTRKRRSCGFSVSDRKGTFLNRIRFPPWKMVLFVNHFLSRYWDHKGVMESLHLSSATSVDWRSFCCEVTDYWFANQEAIGGVGIEVEIDETLISRRKYGRGQMRKQIWLFGGWNASASVALFFH